MKSVRFFTLGCKVNLYETEAMKGLFEKRGYSITESDSADVFVINTCTVTAVGDKKSRQMIRRAKRKNPNAVVAVVGCYAQVSPEKVREIQDVDIILGTTGRKDIVDHVEQFLGQRIDTVQKKIPPVYEDLPSMNQSRARAALKIQDGCNNFCSYCIIPYARGPVRSRPVQSAVSEVQRLVREGFTEVVLVGIHLGSYGRDLGLHLIDMVKAVCAVDGIKRVRLGSLEPNLLTDEFIRELQKLEPLCPSFHVSMQSGCTATLKRMNRKYDAAQYLDAVHRLKDAFPGCAVSTDVIVGFPMESEQEFAESMETVQKCGFADLHVFPYSKREGTVAANMEGQIPEAVKSQRCTAMIEAGKKMQQAFCQAMLGNTYEVLFEHSVGEGRFEGLTRNYVRVVCDGDGLEGQYRDVKLTAFCGDYCEGVIV